LVINVIFSSQFGWIKHSLITPGQLLKSKALIFHYWNIINHCETVRFNREIKVTLLGSNQTENWQQSALTQLQSSCHYLINQRGYAPWEL
jgi:hypothetical protein